MTNYTRARQILRLANAEGIVSAHDLVRRGLLVYPSVGSLAVAYVLASLGIDEQTAGRAAIAEGWTDNPLEGISAC